MKVNEAHNMFGYRGGKPLTGGSTGWRWKWLNFLAGVFEI